jgi:predicted amidohydrolase YtcJ
VILTDDLISVPRDRIAGVQVLTTVVGGKVVHQRRP